MRIYTGKTYADLMAGTAPGWLVFEDIFKEKVSAEYKDCWPLILDEAVVCKTSDAIKSAPPDSIVIRVGRSVRKSDFGELIETEMSLADYLFLDHEMPVDRRQDF